MSESVRSRFFYNGIELGRRIRTAYRKDGKKFNSSYFEPLVDLKGVEDMVKSLSPNERIHLRRSASGLCGYLRSRNIDPKEYITDEDIGIAVDETGAHSIKTLIKSDSTLYELVRKRNLKDIFMDVPHIPKKPLLYTS